MPILAIVPVKARASPEVSATDQLEPLRAVRTMTLTSQLTGPTSMRSEWSFLKQSPAGGPRTLGFPCLAVGRALSDRQSMPFLLIVLGVLQLLIREAEAAGERKIPAGLRAILERALDPDLAGRYVRGRELAEDLDRWRTTRPLVFAVEPYWRYTVPCALKRWRRPLLAAAAALFVVVGLPSTALVIFNSWRTLEDMARDKLERHWDEVEVYRFRRSNLHWLEDSRNGLAFFQALEPNDSSTLETAGRALKNYGVFDPGDWRQREDVRNLPHADREELELWLLEQTFRYCLALSEHSDSREDWLRARNLLEQLGEVASLPIFTTLGRTSRLKARDRDLEPFFFCRIRRSINFARPAFSKRFFAIGERVSDGRRRRMRYRRVN